MSKLAFIFSGQGSQYVGMGRELVDNFICAVKVFRTGSRILGFDILKAVSGDAEELKKTTTAQPCIFAVSLSAYFSARKTGVKPDVVAGHSLGEYAAMVASGMLSVEDGFQMIKLRSEIMGRAAKRKPGGMAAVIGAEVSLVENICNEVRSGNAADYVTPANYNSPVQTVIAGSASGLEKAILRLKENGAKKVVELPVNAAFHSEFMTEAALEFREAVENFTFRKPSIPFYSNLTGKIMTDFSDMPKYLAKHICSPVRFTDELETMKNDGVDFFVEAGPGKTLVGLIRKTLADVRTANIEDSKSLEGVNIIWRS